MTVPSDTDDTDHCMRSSTRMLTIKHYVDKSNIGGCGLFCAEKVDKGDIVYKYDNRFVMLISNDEVASLPLGMREAIDKYAYSGTGAARLVGAVYYCVDDSRFMNHFDTPNIIWNPDGQTYSAGEDILPGVELTCNYADFCGVDDASFRFAKDNAG